MNQIVPSNNETLRKLNLLRYKDEHKPSEQAHLQHRRKQADAPDPALQRAWFHSMFKVLEEMDEVMRCVNGSVPLRFLDLGCCPGGFSSYILSKNPRASGVGISLPEESGGHACLLDEEQLARFQLCWADITQYQLGPAVIDDPQLQYLPLGGGGKFDLVLIDGHPLRCAANANAKTKAKGGTDDVHLHGDRLLISQVIVGLVSVAFGGTLILKQSRPERLVTAQLIFLFDLLCAEVRTWKPVCMHGTQSTFYLVAKGFGLGSQAAAARRAELLGGLQDLWVQLSYGSPDGSGRRLCKGDLDFIVDQRTLKTGYAPRLHELSEHIWVTQSQCLRGWREAQAKGF